MAMCPRSAASDVSNAVKSCPFLHAIKEFQGDEVAAKLCLNPFAPAAETKSCRPILSEDPAGSIAAVFKLFHGKHGPIPLSAKKEIVPPRCPMHPADSSLAETTREGLSPLPALPMMASISISGFKFLPGPGDIFRRNQQQRPKPRKQQGKEPPKPQQQNSSSKPSTTSSSPSSSTKGPSSSPTNSSSSSKSKFSMSTFGPLGGLLPLAAASGKLSCPPAIVAMRAAVAGLKPVRHLRPQALPIRSLAMAGTAILSNVPCGMWREHTKKFSPEWFVAVHATIPFVAMLRKAVLMPRWAIFLTIAGAIVGQQMGAKVEKARLCGDLEVSLPSRVGKQRGSCATEEQQQLQSRRRQSVLAGAGPSRFGVAA